MGISSILPLFAITLVLYALARSAVLKDFTFEASVIEGDMANFTCIIKNDSLGTIQWRIGAFSEHCSGDSIEGTGLHITCSTITERSRKTETIGIMATVDLDGTPVECMVDSFAGVEHDEYSKFALLRVSPATMNDTTLAQKSESSGSSATRTNRRSPFSNEVSLGRDSGNISPSEPSY